MIRPYWDIPTLLLYLLMALIGVIFVNCALKMTINRREKGYVIRNPFYFIIIIVWTFLAVFRSVKEGVGGTDTGEYIYFFKNCWGSYDFMMEHIASDLLFKWINQGVRLFTDDYHVFFLLAYSFIVYSFMTFIQRFCTNISNPIPLLMVFYLYLRGFNTLKSNFCIALILLGLTCVANKRYFSAYLLLICTFLTHKSGFLFGLIIPFSHILNKYRIKKRYLIAISAFLFMMAAGIRDYFIEFASMNDLGGAYGSYAANAKENSSLFSGVVECFMQYVLVATIIFFSNKIIKISHLYGYKVSSNLDMLITICYFDAILIPFNVMMGIWRGYEFCMIPRICMWTYILFFLSEAFPRNSRIVVNTAYLLVILIWFIFRLNRTYMASNLMPYIFSFT